MSPATPDGTNWLRKNAVDVLTFAVAVGLSVLAIVEYGPLGLGAASVLLGVAAAIVVGRYEHSGHVTGGRSDEGNVTGGGRRDD